MYTGKVESKLMLFYVCLNPFVYLKGVCLSGISYRKTDYASVCCKYFPISSISCLVGSISGFISSSVASNEQL